MFDIFFGFEPTTSRNFISYTKRPQFPSFPSNKMFLNNWKNKKPLKTNKKPLKTNKKQGKF